MPLGSAPKTKIDIDYTRAQGKASTGRILFQPPRQKLGSTMLSNAPVPVDLIGGVATVELARLAVGTYKVVEQIDDQQQRTFNFALPLSSAAVIQYEDIVPVSSVPATYTVVRSVGGILPNPTTGDVPIEGIEGPEGPMGPEGPKGDTGAQGIQGNPGPPGADGQDGAQGIQGIPGTPGADGEDGAQGLQGETGPPGADGQDGVLKAFGTTGMVTGTFGPAGDSGTWDLCPSQYRVTVPAEVGDKILWTPGFLHKFDQEAVCDIAALIDGVPVRYRSSGTITPLSSGYGGLYMHATFGGLRAVWWTVASEDISLDGEVTLALAFRNNGAGNMMGHASIAGDITLANAGPGGVI